MHQTFSFLYLLTFKIKFSFHQVNIFVDEKLLFYFD